jgi:hypothetical protein
MTTMTMTSRTAAPRKAMSGVGFGSYLARFRAGIREGQSIAARYDKLSQMSTPDLARHGLTRNDISRVALTGR